MKKTVETTDTPKLRARAYDNACELENLMTTLDSTQQAELVDYVFSTLADIEGVLTEAAANGEDVLSSYLAFKECMRTYMPRL